MKYALALITVMGMSTGSQSQLFANWKAFRKFAIQRVQFMFRLRFFSETLEVYYRLKVL